MCDVSVAAITDMALVDIFECFDDKLAEQLLAVNDCNKARGFSSLSGELVWLYNQFKLQKSIKYQKKIHTLIVETSCNDTGASPPPTAISVCDGGISASS